MKPITTLLTILFITLLSSPSWSETREDLVENPSDGLVYKKFTTIPFTGSVLPTSEEPSRVGTSEPSGCWGRQRFLFSHYAQEDHLQRVAGMGGHHTPCNAHWQLYRSLTKAG